MSRIGALNSWHFPPPENVEERYEHLRPFFHPPRVSGLRDSIGFARGSRADGERGLPAIP